MVAYKERSPGIYPARFVKLDTDYKITDKETGDELTRWRWVFQDVNDTTTVGELDTITSPSFKARTNGLKLFTGMLGRAPTENDDTDDLIGQIFDVVYGPNQNQRLTVTGATKRTGNVQTAPVPTAAAQPASQPVYEGMEGYGEPKPAAEATEPDDLPF